MKRTLGMMLLVMSCAVPVAAKKTVYIANDHRFNFVKVKEIAIHDAEARVMSHPSDVDEDKIRKALASLRLSRRHLISKEVDTQVIFDDDAIAFLAPFLTRAFHEASSTDEVVFSYMSRNPQFILRDNRLTIGATWIHGKELHLKFKKLYAKVTGDIDKRGSEARAGSRAKGIRVALDLQPGQRLAEHDAEEVVINLDQSWEVAADNAPPAAPEGGEEKPKAAASGETAEASGVKERLEKLEELKKEGLISKKEYREKRQDILRDL